MKPLRLLLSLLLFLAFAPGAFATDAIVQLPDDSANTGKKLDESSLTVGANTTLRQRIVIADPTTAASIAAVKAASTAAVATDPALVVSISPNNGVQPVDASANTLASTKGTQTTNFVGVQQAHDAGRTQFRFYATAVASGTTTTETIFTLTKSSGTAATTTATTFTPTSGKTFRITGITFASRGNATATAQVTKFSLRVNTGGACIVSSTPIIYSANTATAAVASAYDRFSPPLYDGDEIAGNGTLQWCLTANAVFVTNAPTWDVLITGYEY